MEQELLQLLADTQSADGNVRKAAELQLHQSRLYANEAFPLSLAAIASHSSVPVSLRQSALSVLRSFIAASWSPNLDEFKGHVLLSDDSKTHVRRLLLDLATTPDPAVERKVRSAASYAVSKIASADFPEQWPELLPSLLRIITDATGAMAVARPTDSAVPAAATTTTSSSPDMHASLHGALKVLLDLVDTGFSEEHFYLVARELVSALYAVAVNESIKPMLRALAVAVFRSCFDTLEMVLEQQKSAVRQFVDEVLAGWSPFFVATLKASLPPAPSQEDESRDGEAPSQWRGVIALKLQVVKTLMKIRMVFPRLLTGQSLVYFELVWTELSTVLDTYSDFYVHNERQGRLEDVDGLPYTLDFLVLEELDLIQALLKAPPVKAELQRQLQAAATTSASTSAAAWLSELIKIASSYAQIPQEVEMPWEMSIDLFLSEETSVTANYTPRTCAGDLAIKLGEWLKSTAAESLLFYSNSVFADPSSSWKARESALFLLNQILRDFSEVDQQISLEFASSLDRLIRFAIGQGELFLRARGFLVAGALARVAASKEESFLPMATHYLEASLQQGLTQDPSEVVQVACIRTVQDLFLSMPASCSAPAQVAAISAIGKFVHEAAANGQFSGGEGDEVKVLVAETLRDIIMVDPGIVLSSVALDVLFQVAGANNASSSVTAAAGAANFQLTMVVTEAFEDIVAAIAQQGPDRYTQLCERVLPSLTAAMDVEQAGATSAESAKALTHLATDLVRILAAKGPMPLPAGFVAVVMPKLNGILLESSDAELIRPATEAVRHLLSHDFEQFVGWQEAGTGKGAVEAVLVILDRLLGPTIDDYAATDVGQLAAEVVERAGSARLGPYLPQLLRAVAQRLATAEQAPLIQSLILVFARLTLISAREVVDFLAQISLTGTGVTGATGDDSASTSASNGLAVVMGKWLENSVHFAGYDEIRQNIAALAELYLLGDERLAQVAVRGDLIITDTGRIKTRSQARMNPDRYTTVSVPLKILKVLVEELAAVSGNVSLGPAELGTQRGSHKAGESATSAGRDKPLQDTNGVGDGGGDGHDHDSNDSEDDDDADADDDDDDDDDEWEDLPGTGGQTLDLGLGVTKQQLMAFGQGGSEGVFGLRQPDSETQAFLERFLLQAATQADFAALFTGLTAAEQRKVRAVIAR